MVHQYPYLAGNISPPPTTNIVILVSVVVCYMFCVVERVHFFCEVNYSIDIIIIL